MTDSMSRQLLEWRESLEQNKKVKETLEMLNIALESAQSHAEVLQIAAVISPDLLYSFLEAHRTPGKDVKLVCAVLSKLFPAFSSAKLAEMRYHWELGLQHPVADVRQVCLEVLKHRASDEQANEPMRALILQPTLFHLITQLIADGELKCAQLVDDLVILLASQPSCLKLITNTLKEGFLIDLRGAAEKNSTVRFRVYDLAVKFSLLGGDAFEFITDTGVLIDLISELESDDILVKLNSLETLTKLRQCHEGMKMLSECNVVKKLHTILATVEQDAFAPLLVPGILKFFGHYCLSLGADLSTICAQYPQFLRTTLVAIRSPEEVTVWSVAMDTFAILTSAMIGKKVMMENCLSELKDSLKHIGQLISGTQSEVRVHCLQCLTTVYLIEDEEREHSALCQEWFQLISPTLLSCVFKILKLPFIDLRSSSLNFVLSLASHKWAQEQMKDQPAFVEYLLDRRTESEKTCKELKYSIIHRMTESPFAESSFCNQLFLKLKEYVKEGPFYESTEAAVAFEEMQ